MAHANRGTLSRAPRLEIDSATYFAVAGENIVNSGHYVLPATPMGNARTLLEPMIQDIYCIVYKWYSNLYHNCMSAVLLIM